MTADDDAAGGYWWLTTSMLALQCQDFDFCGVIQLFSNKASAKITACKKIDQHQHANSSIAPSIQIRWSLCIFHSVSLRFILKASQNRAETEWLNDNDCLPSSIVIFSQIAKLSLLWGGNTGNHGASSRSKCTTIVGWEHQGDGGNSVNMCSWDQLHVLCLPCHALELKGREFSWESEMKCFHGIVGLNAPAFLSFDLLGEGSLRF